MSGRTQVSCALCGKEALSKDETGLNKKLIHPQIERMMCLTCIAEYFETTEEELKEMMKRSGRILLISNLDVPEKTVYEIYKKREQVEKLFDSYKSTLSSDRLYLHDNESVFGHVFVSFLSLYAYSRIELALKKADINDKLSPIDVLLEFSKVYHYDLGGQEQITEVPRKVLDIEARLGLNIFPIFVRS